jgi:hypothetical protein
MGERPVFRINFYLILMASFFLLSCTPRVDVKEPLELVWDKSGGETDQLIVFLPGLYDVAEKFKEEQFFSLARKEGIKADMVAASVHLDHLLENHVVERIERDVFTPALNLGYKNIWFVGVSLGGLNSLLFYKKHAGLICGVVLLAPYLGDKSITSAIQNAGGIKNWQPDQFDKPEQVKDKALVDLHIQNLWNWIKLDKKNGNKLKQVYLGFGSHDRYAKAHQIFTSFLDEKNVHTVNGEHNWKTGRKIWQQQLASRNKTGLLNSCN